jgi:hypothetical protein
MTRPLYELASAIKTDTYGKSWFAYAKPYVDALETLTTIEDNYYADSGRSIVSYALANLGSWRGETAKSVKAELKLHLAGKA